MRSIWDFFERRNWRAETKYKALLWLLSMVFGLAGALVWGIVQIWALKTADWLICFVGYPVILSWLLVVFYSGRHDFHNGPGKQQSRQ